METVSRNPFRRKIRLTGRQAYRVVSDFADYDLDATIENCRTGSVYICVYIPVNRDTNGILGGTEVARIRLSGHREGKRRTNTHIAIGDKEQCMAALKLWVKSVCDEFGVKQPTVRKYGRLFL